MEIGGLRKAIDPKPQPAPRMTAKGTSFLARRFLLEQEFAKDLGETRVQAMFDAAVAAVPLLPSPILASTPIPMAAYLQFNDEILDRYYGGDPNAFYRFGERSAEYSLTAGPYKRLMVDKDVATFATQGDVLYRNFYDLGAARTSLVDGRVDFHIEGIPQPYRHLFLEYATLGYYRRALEMLGASRVTLKRVRGYSLRNEDVYYQLTFVDPAVAAKLR